MNENYERRMIRVAPRSWPRAIEQVREVAAPAVREAGGSLFGLFLGQIGLGANEAVVLSAWPDEESSRRSGVLSIAGVDDVLESDAEQLVATVRPVDPTPPTRPGVYAHRRFEIQEKDWPEFLELSSGAWPDFESAYDVRVIGFWRSLDVASPRARVELLTFYPTLAHWERSRGPRGGARGPTADAPTPTESHRRFGRRHELTEDTCVVTTRLARLEG